MNPSATTAATKTSLDPITLEVIRNKLDGIASEMETTLFKSAFSPIVKEGLDASAALFDADGTMLAQACAVPIHLATLMPALAEVIKTFPPDTMQAGDIYMLNDPYCGGTHLPDVAIIMPIIVRDRLLAFSACMTHHQDLGGMRAGSVPTDATEIFQEGLRIPPVRWCRAGEFDPTLTAILRLNVRIPDTFMGDLHAQVAACKVGTLRLGALAQKYGDNFLTVAFGELLDRSEMMTREALRQIPAGTYRAVDYLDNDGIDLDRRIRIEVAATVGDGEILFDLTGSNEQVRGPLNCVPSGSLAAACFAVRALTDPSIPTNGGCFRPIRLNLPEGSIVNPKSPAPVNSRTATIKRITSCMLATLTEVLPDKVPAESGGELLVLAFGGAYHPPRPSGRPTRALQTPSPMESAAWSPSARPHPRSAQPPERAPRARLTGPARPRHGSRLRLHSRRRRRTGDVSVPELADRPPALRGFADEPDLDLAVSSIGRRIVRNVGQRVTVDAELPVHPLVKGAQVLDIDVGIFPEKAVPTGDVGQRFHSGTETGCK
jgi:N-methylhydantoinase B/oxoprolinase/acetone carboxylase alpha subunit